MPFGCHSDVLDACVLQEEKRPYDDKAKAGKEGKDAKESKSDAKSSEAKGDGKEAKDGKETKDASKGVGACLAWLLRVWALSRQQRMPACDRAHDRLLG